MLLNIDSDTRVSWRFFLQTHTHTYTHTHIYIYVCVCVCVCAFVCMSVCMYNINKWIYIIHIYIYIYIYNAMEYRLRPRVLWIFFVKNLHETQGSQSLFYGIKYIYLIYIYLLLWCSSSILDSERSPDYIALGSPQTHKVIYWQPTLL